MIHPHLPSASSSLAEAGLAIGGWFAIVHGAVGSTIHHAVFAQAGASLPTGSDAAQTTLCIAVGGVLLQIVKLYLDFKGRSQAVELDQVKRDAAKDAEQFRHDAARDAVELRASAAEIKTLRELLYGLKSDIKNLGNVPAPPTNPETPRGQTRPPDRIDQHMDGVQPG